MVKLPFNLIIFHGWGLMAIIRKRNKQCVGLRQPEAVSADGVCWVPSGPPIAEICPTRCGLPEVCFEV